MVKNGTAIVIRPEAALRVKRVDTRKDRLYAAYDQGYADTEKVFDALRDFLS